MGYVEIIKDGVMVQMQDGQVTRVTATTDCDKCNKLADPVGGIEITDLDNQVVLWICAQCRNE
jgi:hypothetical protein